MIKKASFETKWGTAVYQAILDFWLSNYHAPTRRQIKAAVGNVSLSVVHFTVRKLASEGHILLTGDGRPIPAAIRDGLAQLHQSGYFVEES